MANKQIEKVTLQMEGGASGSLLATWVWSNKTDLSHTENYEYIFSYLTSNGVWIQGSRSTSDTSNKTALYSIPDNALRVKFKVKPIAKKHKVNGNEEPWFTSAWSKEVVYVVGTVGTPPVPAVPSIKVERLDGKDDKNNAIDVFKLTVQVNIYDTLTDYVEFTVIQNDNSRWHSAIVKVSMNIASYSWSTLEPGNVYKVRARAINKYQSKTDPTYKYIHETYEKNNADLISEWSEYSENVGTPPSRPEISKCKLINASTMQVHWSLIPNVKNTDSYIIEYSISAGYFDSGSSEVSQVTVEGYNWHAEIPGLEIGRMWYFRLRAENEYGSSSWSKIVKHVAGKRPSAPTTWSESSTVAVGNKANLYWTHNAEDESDQTHAEIKLMVNGNRVNARSEMSEGMIDLNDMLTSKSTGFDTSSYVSGTVLKWSVRTIGALVKNDDNEYVWGPWSEERIVRIYAPPVLTEFGLPDTVSSFPINFHSTASPSSQTAISFEFSIRTRSAYYIDDVSAGRIYINAGDEVFHTIVLPETRNVFDFTLLPEHVTLNNNTTYVATLKASMNSGLMAEVEEEFITAFDNVGFGDINAGLTYYPDSYSMAIRPYCVDEEGNYLDNMILSVYRREYDGGFVEIASGIINGSGETVIDPHPALDYARYRIVVMSTVTGHMNYYDMPGIPIEESAIVIQWDEELSSFFSDEENELEEQPYTASIVVLPYNVDISDSYSPDVALVNYIGRSYPVSYYGTQRGVSASWNTDIPANDVETIYALRKLAVYNGDVYVREPSGSGYWAQVTVSFSKKHDSLVVPVSLNIKRVEGGM